MYKQFYSATYSRFQITSRHDLTKGLFDLKSRKWLLAEKYDNILYESSGDGGVFYIAIRANDSLRFFLSMKGQFTVVKAAKPKPAPVEPAPGQNIVEEESPPEVKYLIERTSSSENFRMAGFYKVAGKFGYHYTVAQNGVRTADSIPAIYDTIVKLPGDDQVLIVRRNGKAGVITVKNKEVLPFLYDDVKAVDSTIIHGIYIVRLNGKYGLANANKLLVPCKYDTISQTSFDIRGFMLTQNNKSGAYIYDRQRLLYHKIIPAEYDYIMGLVGFRANNFDRSITTPFRYEDVMWLADVRKNGKRGYIDLNGREYFKQ